MQLFPKPCKNRRMIVMRRLMIFWKLWSIGSRAPTILVPSEPVYQARPARAALDRAQLDREETTIHAPIGGLIGTVEVSVGNYVGRGESNRLATISQLDPINVVFRISEALYLRTVDKVDRKALARIDLILSDNSQYPFQGRYTNIGSAVDEKTGTLQIGRAHV